MKNVLGPDADCSISPAPLEDAAALGTASAIIRRKWVQGCRLRWGSQEGSCGSEGMFG